MLYQIVPCGGVSIVCAKAASFGGLDTGLNLEMVALEAGEDVFFPLFGMMCQFAACGGISRRCDFAVAFLLQAACFDSSCSGRDCRFLTGGEEGGVAGCVAGFGFFLFLGGIVDLNCGKFDELDVGSRCAKSRYDGLECCNGG